MDEQKFLAVILDIKDSHELFNSDNYYEEIGNDIYPPMKRALMAHDIPFEKHFAKQITKEDYKNADVIFYMDNVNLSYLNYLLNDNQNKIELISKYTENLEYIEDPWYSGEYEIVINELIQCCEDIIKNLK